MKENLRSAFNRRQYMLAKDFELYYYSDDAFRNVDPHAHDYYEFYIFLEGDVAMEIEGDQKPLQKGDIVLIPPGIRHRAVRRRESGIYRRFVFWVSRDFASSLLNQSPDYVWLMQKAETQHQYLWHLEAADFHSVEARVLRLLEESHGDRYGKSAAMSIAAEDLVLTINRAVYEASLPVRGREQDLFTSIVQYLDSNLSGDLSLDVLAAKFYVSKYYISHLFTETMGLSLHQYVIRKRLQACRNDILSGKPVTGVYLQYGFKDYSAFYRAFRAEYGISPRDLQKQAAGLRLEN